MASLCLPVYVDLLNKAKTCCCLAKFTKKIGSAICQESGYSEIFILQNEKDVVKFQPMVDFLEDITC